MALKPNPLGSTSAAAEKAAHEAAERDQRENPHRWGNGPEHTPGPLRDALHHAERSTASQPEPVTPGLQASGSKSKGK
jgi:hypothetical protein